MSLINVTDLTFGYDGAYDTVFENVSFQMDTDWKLGLTGRNGRGKTTLFRLLMHEFEYSGKISADVDFEYFPYPVEHTDWLTSDIAGEIAPNASDWEFSKEFFLLGLDEDVFYRQFCTLSKGEQTKVLLAALFLKENSFLLIDEPTNHLDTQAREKLAAYLSAKKGFILISHDRYILDSCVNHILAINKTGIEIVRGNFSDWQRNKNLRDEFEIRENKKLKGEIRRLEQSARRSGIWSYKTEKSKFNQKNSGLKIDRGFVGHKSAKMMKRAKTIEARQKSMAEEKAKLLHNIESAQPLQIMPLAYFNDVLAEFKNVSVFYGKKEVFRNISFKLNRGDITALCGGNGSGKSSILKLLCGEDICYTGEIIKSSRLIVFYVSQNTDDVKGSISDYARRKEIDESLLKSVLSKLGVSDAQLEKRIEDLSEGQRKKVLISASLCTRAHLYVWDEPLNFLDVISRMQLENLLCSYKPSMIFVEHDKTFCENTASQKIEL